MAHCDDDGHWCPDCHRETRPSGVRSDALLDFLASYVVTLFPRGGNPLVFVFPDDQRSAIAFADKAFTDTCDEVLVGKVIHQRKSNSRIRRLDFAYTGSVPTPSAKPQQEVTNAKRD